MCCKIFTENRDKYFVIISEYVSRCIPTSIYGFSRNREYKWVLRWFISRTFVWNPPERFLFAPRGWICQEKWQLMVVLFFFLLFYINYLCYSIYPQKALRKMRVPGFHPLRRGSRVSLRAPGSLHRDGNGTRCRIHRDDVNLRTYRE